MSQNELETEKMPKKERKKFFQELQLRQQKSDQKRLIITKIAFTVAAAGLLAAIIYLFAATKPVDQNRSSSAMSSIGNLKLGDSAPAFSLPATTGKTVSLKDYKGKNVLLYFQEGVMCAPCWEQLGRMQVSIDRFNQVKTQIISISINTKEVWEPVLAAEKVVDIPVLVDSEREASKAYGVLNLPSQMHSDRPGHTFILVDKDGKIRWIADYPTMRVPEEEILNSIKKSLETT